MATSSCAGLHMPNNCLRVMHFSLKNKLQFHLVVLVPVLADLPAAKLFLPAPPASSRRSNMRMNGNSSAAATMSSVIKVSGMSHHHHLLLLLFLLSIPTPAFTHFRVNIAAFIIQPRICVYLTRLLFLIGF